MTRRVHDFIMTRRDTSRTAGLAMLLAALLSTTAGAQDGNASRANATTFSGALEAYVSAELLLAYPLASLERIGLQDPADSLFRAGHTALRRSEHQRAAELFRGVRTRYARSLQAIDAWYWEAFALQRLGGLQNLSAALELLRTQQQMYENAPSAADTRALAARIEGQLASRGDAASARRITERAEAMTQTCPREDEDERLMVLDALLTMDSERALPTLKSVLVRRDACSAVLRRKAVFLVSRKQSAETEDILLNALRTDPDREVREQAVFWLGRVNSEKATTALIDILRSSNDANILDQAILALSQQRSERASAALRDLVRRNDASRGARSSAILGLSRQSRNPDEAVKFLVELYPTLADAALRETVLFSVAEHKTPEAQRFLVQLALNPREPIAARQSAIFQAGRTGLSLAQLREIYRTAPDREIKDQIIFAIHNRKTPEAVEALLDIAKNDPDREMRSRAIFWLGQTRDPKAIEFFRQLLDK